MEVTRLSHYPDKNGLAGAMAGTINGRLIVCGGTHFENNTPPWDGGKKQWLDSIFLLENVDGEWRKIGTLSTPLAHAAAVTTPEGILIIGGCDSACHFADVRLLTISADEKLAEKKLPSLPQPLAYCAAVLADGVVYVAGGQVTPDVAKTSDAFYAMNLRAESPHWVTLPSLPGASRMLTSLGEADGKIYMIGGVSLFENSAGDVARRYLADAWYFTPVADGAWHPLPDLPHWVAGAVTPLPEIQKQKLAVIGGDARENPAAAPATVTSFSKRIHFLDTKNNTWISGDASMPEGRAVTASCAWGDGVVIIGGEPRPGHRSRDVFFLKTEGRAK